MATHLKFWKSVKQNDGGTIGTHKRFIVSITNNKIRDFKNITYTQFKGYLNGLNNTAKELNLKGFCFGYWKENGFLYLDLNLSTNDKKHAQIIGFYFNQLAVYDSVKGKEIFLKGVKNG